MLSGRTTQDLIAAAREDASLMAAARTCLRLHVHALADRLEEVEEERARGRKALEELVGDWHRWAYAQRQLETEEGSIRSDAIVRCNRDLRRTIAEIAGEPWPPTTLPASPEPSDLEPDETDTAYQPTPWEDSDGHDLADHIGALAVLAGGQSKKAVADIRDRALALYARIRREARLDTSDVPERAELVEPEPTDDPWAYVERYAATSRHTPLRTPFIDALLDLRERVEGNDDRAYQAVRQNDRKIAALESQMDTIHAIHTIALNAAVEVRDRLNALEGHADRGSEAERELRGRVGRLEDKARHSLRARATLRDDLEKIDDWTERLAERVERLEALDRATTTVHDNLIEELLGRVETLEREQERREDYEMEQREREA